MKVRLDKWLHEKKRVPSRTKAQDLIEKGFVRVNGEIQTKSHLMIDSGSNIEILESDELRFVSRGGLKLEAALEHLNWSVDHLQALDIGLSTGGFADCLIQRGATKVVGIDVGQNQLHESLKGHRQIQSFEKINARDLSQYKEVITEMPSQGWDLIVIDVSFISLSLILPQLKAYCRNRVLALVKPQFEVGKDGLNKLGIVRDEGLYADVKSRMIHCAESAEFRVHDYFESALLGKDGNREFFMALTRE